MRRLLSGAYRRARRAEGRGDYREAAALYAEADMPDEAAKALLFHAARAKGTEERLAAYHDALRWLDEDHPRRLEVEAQIGLTILDGAQEHGAHTAEEKRQLRDAAARLERAGKEADAATAYEILGQTDDVARCLQAAGEVERLEALLEETTEQSRIERKLRRLIADYEMTMAVGARDDAREALKEALDVAPNDPGVADLLRRFEARLLPLRQLTLRVGDRERVFVGSDSVEVGRDADVVVRGASVSRRHARVSMRDGAVVIRDLDSRNGTLVRGVPIHGELQVEGATEIGLGDDVTVRVVPTPAGLEVEVLEGLDRGRYVVAGTGPLRTEGLPATVQFPAGRAVLEADSRV
ncbi:MAG: FHA domain-containing protein, partial [Myxococcota bacterium]